MPQIIVTADRGSEQREAPVLWREWVNRTDFESEMFSRHLVQRLGWAIDDACKVEEDAAAHALVNH
jgi:hypothetical protein